MIDTCNSPWNTVPLAEVATIERHAISPEEIRSGTLYVGLEHLDSAGSFLDVGPVQAGDLASTKFQFTPDHILYGKLRPYLVAIPEPWFVSR
jgi:type I restriction enzyme S subunit